MAAPPDSGGGGAVLSVRIVSHDYYMAPPIPDLDFSFSPFQGRQIEEVPVIRIYGSTPAGQKTCLHVHKALPYLYVPCPDEIIQNPDTAKGNSYINGLMTALEKALKTRGPSKRQHVHGCTLVKAKKIYGYYPKEELFVKIYLYYPHDVARASTVFLSGAVMNRIFQPYESHIPYLLQFLIDYNLYGMSHIHVSNMKFRPPLPEFFNSKIISSQNPKEKSDSASDNSQADCYSGAIGDLAIWTLSTVPNNLIWDYSNNENFARCQSISMLEADSTVDDILNEKYKIYTSLSQTSSDIKMVQSLVPIWEEFKRTGMQEEQIPPDLNKPKPEAVLTRFFNDSEYENILSNLISEEGISPSSLSPAEEAERLEQCIKSLTGVCGPSPFNQTDVSAGVLSKENEKDVMIEMNEAPVSQDRKHVDEEALGLLSWLASSQAKNELNSDDELQNEAILSPLFCKKSYQLALETAHTDFEIASQKECQDILDSIEKENESISTSSIDDLVIPQVDGSMDEKEYKTPCNKKLVKRNNRENKAIWGNLPLSIKRREIGNSTASSSFESIHGDLNSNNSELNSFSCEATESKGLVQCSVRDLMRRKRSFQPEGSESENPRIKLDFESSTQDLHISQKDPCEKLNFVEMAFFEKPPRREKVADFDYSLDPSLNAVGPGSNNNLLPFFESDDKKGNKSYSEEQNQNPNSQETALGVPTHFQNDGSVLYLLTHASSPPNHNAVCQWLFEETQPKIKIDQADDVSIANPNMAELSKGEKDMKENEGTVTDTGRIGTGTESCNDFSQISGPDERGKLTPLSQIGFRDPASVGCGQQLTIISLEVLAESRGHLRPDPKFDKINIISFCVQEDWSPNIEVYVLMRGSSEEYCKRNVDGISRCNFVIFPEEWYLLEHFINIITTLDPDILIGWEIQCESLGYLTERSLYLGITLLKQISRTPDAKLKNSKDLTEKEPASSTSITGIVDDEWGRTHASGIHVEGRIVLNLWRLMRGEVKINMYSFEAVVEEVLRRKVPLVPVRVLNRWLASGPALGRYKCVEYVIQRARLNLEMMNQLDMINRTSELARVFGIDFFSVLSRGSQFRVESMLLRLAHTQNYIAISPGSEQVASQPAMECLPLVMEPESGFYTDPVVVLDFQSLYPSMIIAYNLCYSTCLGKVFPSKSSVFGVSSSPDLCVLNDIKDDLLLTPNGVLYVQAKVRKGVLPRLLNEILSTRIMVKQAMKKLLPSQQVLQRIYNARQLALKLIANVTYGYTAAGFSGRMPCAELADSIVQCGRRTLETAILFVNQNPKWKARVVYGDTDSMFVLLKGRSIEEAFKIGKEIAFAITGINPDPVTLKLEKVYKSCFLLTKKRYVGYSFESLDQREPVFDAKGIETVRRDTCLAVAKILERSIRIMFEHQDINKVKSYLERQWSRILSGKISLQDFIFAKEVRLGTYSNKASTLPPSAIVALKLMQLDPRTEPHYGERVPYVVVHGEPGARLIDLVVDPYLLLDIDAPYRLNDMYYIKKQIIPALQRVFGLVGADLYQWFGELARPVRRDIRRNFLGGNKGGRIDRYYKSKHCIVCGEFTKRVECVCDECVKKGDLVGTVLIGRVSKLEREMHHLAAICRHCGGADWVVESGVKCVSLACPVFYERRKAQKELKSLSNLVGDAGFYPHCMVELF